MGLQDSAFGSNFERSFEPDDFYESFQAPKFHDFTAPEEPIDPDAFFMAQPGMVAKTAIVMEDIKTMAPKIHKVAAQDFPMTAQGSVQEVPPNTPISAEKAVCCRCPLAQAPGKALLYLKRTLKRRRISDHLLHERHLSLTVYSSHISTNQCPNSRSLPKAVLVVGERATAHLSFLETIFLKPTLLPFYLFADDVAGLDLVIMYFSTSDFINDMRMSSHCLLPQSHWPFRSDTTHFCLLTYEFEDGSWLWFSSVNTVISAADYGKAVKILAWLRLW